MIGKLWSFVYDYWLPQRPLVISADRLVDRAREASQLSNPNEALKRLYLLGQRSQAGIRKELRRQRSIDKRVLAITDAIVTEASRRTEQLVDIPPGLADILPNDLRELRTMQYDRGEAARFADELRASETPSD